MDKMLICLVRCNEMLYKFDNKCYNEPAKKEEVWSQIGLQLNRPGARCKVRWSNLRDQFRRALRNKKSSTKKWKFEDDMAFLLPYFQDTKESVLGPPDVNDAQSIDAFFKSDDDINDTQLVTEEDSTENKKKFRKSIRKRKKKMEAGTSGTLINHIIQQKKNDDAKANDADYSFFVSMAETVKSFRPTNKNIAKRKIFEIISKLEMEEIANTITAQGGPNEGATNEQMLASAYGKKSDTFAIKTSPRDSNSD